MYLRYDWNLLLDKLNCIAAWGSGLEQEENCQTTRPCIGMQLVLGSEYISSFLVDYDCSNITSFSNYINSEAPDIDMLYSDSALNIYSVVFYSRNRKYTSEFRSSYIFNLLKNNVSSYNVAIHDGFFILRLLIFSWTTIFFNFRLF